MKALVAAALGAFLAAVCAPVAAQGAYDVLVGTSGGPVPGSKLTIGFFSHGGVPPAGGFATDAITGNKLFPANFGDFAGGPDKTDDPGFQGFAGSFSFGEIVSARGLGALQYWSSAARNWTPPPAGEVVRLFGGVPTDVATAYLFCQSGGDLCEPGLAAQYPFYAAGTVFSAGGVSGPNPTIIDEASPAGAFHAHLDWFIERGGAAPSAGAYMLTLQLTAGGKYADSDPFAVVFNFGLPPAQFQEAVFSRTQPIPEPSTLATMLAGLALLAGLARFRSSR